MLQTGTFQSVHFEDGNLQSITGCSGYNKYSFEELRANDYACGKKFRLMKRYVSISKKPSKIQRKKPLIRKFVEKISKSEYMEIDEYKSSKISNPIYSISLHEVAGPGFQPYLPRNIKNLKVQNSDLESSDVVLDMPYFSAPNLSMSVNSTTKIRSVSNLSLQPQSAMDQYRRVPEAKIPDSAKIVSANTDNIFRPAEQVIKPQYHSMNSITDVLMRNPDKLGNKSPDFVSVNNIAESLEFEFKAGKSTRESKLEEMNNELIKQLRDMRIQCDYYKQENKRLALSVTRLSRDLETINMTRSTSVDQSQ
eukprot:NODE_21_length_42443_cov_0.822808.p14 type:complete len:308 gc:universal NODE_21_length_42443_cov_0.822808:5433-4510(-)